MKICFALSAFAVLLLACCTTLVYGQTDAEIGPRKLSEYLVKTHVPWKTKASTPGASIEARETGRQDEWLQSHLGIDSRLPFSFVYGKQLSSDVLKVWQKKTEFQTLDGGRAEHRVIWTDPKTQLQVRLTAVGYPDSSVIEWTVYF